MGDVRGMEIYKGQDDINYLQDIFRKYNRYSSEIEKKPKRDERLGLLGFSQKIQE
jgi:hypothetical protein